MARFLTPARLVAAGLILLALVAILYFAPSDEYIFLPDKARAVAPLKAAEDAIHVDSSSIPLSEVVHALEAELLRRMAARK